MDENIVRILASYGCKYMADDNKEMIEEIEVYVKKREEQLPIHSVVCSYDLAWVGKCGKETTDGYCEEHKGIKCCKCGKQAVKQCEYASQLVCGAPLCGDCKHDH